MKKIITNTVVSTLLLMSTLNANSTVVVPDVQTQVPQTSNAMQHKLTLYGWLPSFDGTLTYQLPDGSDTQSDFAVFDALDFVLMGSYEATKGKWSFLADFIYVGVSGEETIKQGSVLETSFDQELSISVLSLYGGYNAIKTDRYSLDVIAGMRSFSMDVDADINFANLRPTVSLSPSVDIYDAVIGVKGNIKINQNWYIPYLVDIGAGDSDLTWQAEASLGYHFSWGDIIATYRYIHYEKEGLTLIEDFDLYGPKLGVVFHF